MTALRILYISVPEVNSILCVIVFDEQSFANTSIKHANSK